MKKELFSIFLVLIGIPFETGICADATKLGALREFYYDLHENPELSQEEIRTARKVADELRRIGLEVAEGIGGHGVIGVLRNGPGPTTLIRAELDALPVREETRARYESRVSGRMHACGHDLHLTILMGTASAMMSQKHDWKGTLVFLAQPAEENGLGAQAMIQDGLLKRIPKPDQAIALHTDGNVPVGKLGITEGFALANTDSIDVSFKGRGAPGAAPQRGIDPTILSAEFILRIQTLVGREKDPVKPAVISVGSVHGGSTHNIIPEEVHLQMTLRTFDSSLRDFLKRRVREIAQGLAETAGAPDPSVTFSEPSDAIYNDPALGRKIRARFANAFGSSTVVDTPALMSGEDFGRFGAVGGFPSFIFWLGERSGRDSAPNHSPRFLPDLEKTLPLGIEAMVQAILALQSAP